MNAASLALSQLNFPLKLSSFMFKPWTIFTETNNKDSKSSLGVNKKIETAVDGKLKDDSSARIRSQLIG